MSNYLIQTHSGLARTGQRATIVEAVMPEEPPNILCSILWLVSFFLPWELLTRALLKESLNAEPHFRTCLLGNLVHDICCQDGSAKAGVKMGPMT